MIIVMESSATEEQICGVDERLQALGFRTILNRGELMTVVAAIGDKSTIELEALGSMAGVRQIVPIREPFKMASRQAKHQDTIIEFSNGVKIGTGCDFAIMAGPCSVEDDRDNILLVAQAVKEMGAQFLRGGAFKPRTSPYDFQGLEKKGLEILAEAANKLGLLVITEVMDSQEVDLVAEYSDVLQVGARNMQNFKLLKQVGKQKKPVMLKRGLSATIREWLLAAEHIIYQGNSQVILCERGIRGFDSTFTRNVLDIAAVPVLRHISHLPIIVDPSHATGQRYLIEPMARAAVVSGAHGLMVEVHHDPDKALSDGPQSLTIKDFKELVTRLKPLIKLEQEQHQ